jgi:hypothetical protein
MSAGNDCRATKRRVLNAACWMLRFRGYCRAVNHRTSDIRNVATRLRSAYDHERFFTPSVAVQSRPVIKRERENPARTIYWVHEGWKQLGGGS